MSKKKKNTLILIYYFFFKSIEGLIKVLSFLYTGHLMFI